MERMPGISGGGNLVFGSIVTSPILWQKSQEMPSAAIPFNDIGIAGLGITPFERSTVRLVWHPDQLQFWLLGDVDASGVWQAAQLPARPGLSNWKPGPWYGWFGSGGRAAPASLSCVSCPGLPLTFDPVYIEIKRGLMAACAWASLCHSVYSRWHKPQLAEPLTPSKENPG